MVLQQRGGTDITKTVGKAVFGDYFCIATYTPEQRQNLRLQKKKILLFLLPDFATGVQPPGIPMVTYKGVMTIDFPGHTEFIGIRDFQRKVIIQKITDTSMRLVMFMALLQSIFNLSNCTLQLLTSTEFRSSKIT